MEIVTAAVFSQVREEKVGSAAAAATTGGGNGWSLSGVEMAVERGETTGKKTTPPLHRAAVLAG